MSAIELAVQSPTPEVMRVRDICLAQLKALLQRVGMQPTEAMPGAAIPGSYWGDSEAGLISNRLYFRADTPLQSVLHECCHYLCMDERRRATLNRDAGGDYDEENAVCYLQVVLADDIDGFGRARMLLDMDAWGYTFRLGSARAWFEQEAEDARLWLVRAGMLDSAGKPTWQRRQ